MDSEKEQHQSQEPLVLLHQLHKVSKVSLQILVSKIKVDQ
jgi:hypothetical protein